MTSVDRTRDKNAQAVIDEAAEWVVRVSAPDVSHEDKREFIAWLKRPVLDRKSVV